MKPKSTRTRQPRHPSKPPSRDSRKRRRKKPTAKGPRRPRPNAGSPEAGTELEQRLNLGRIFTNTHWQQRVLRRVAGEKGPTFLVLFQRQPARESDSPTLHFVFCGGMLEGDQWASAGFEYEAPHIKLVFPHDVYRGMPLHLYLEMPHHDGLGSRWILRGEDGQRVEATFVLTHELDHSGAAVERLIQEHFTK